MSLSRVSLICIAVALGACGNRSILGDRDGASSDAPSNNDGMSVETSTDSSVDVASDERPDTVVVDMRVEEDVADVVSDTADVVTPDVAPDVVSTDGPTGEGGIVCSMGETLCGTRCANTQTDNNNCGGCAIVCSGGRSCQAGRCTCPTGSMLCGDTCIDVTSDPANCGMCGRSCSMGQTCGMGTCACAAGATMCGTSCANTQSDPTNCGMCGRACAMGQTCSMGACVCEAGTTMCGSGTSTACVNTQTDNNNCGMCGRSCPAGATCRAGACTCSMGQALCGTGAMARCVNTQTDGENCGMCGNACPTGQSCSMGRCVCPTGQTSCGMGAMARCVDVNTDPANCGMCGNACAMNQLCNAGRCEINCSSPRTRCGMGATQVCTDLQSDENNCGMCGNQCAVTANAQAASCLSGACILLCRATYGNCDNNYANGCETDITINSSHCGRCGSACPGALPDASSVVCRNSTCLPVCNTGRGDCDGNTTNGCETSLMNNNTHCGACGNTCTSGFTCSGTMCVPVNFNPPTGMTTTINQVAVPVMSGTMGGTTLTLMNTTGLQAGQRVVIHQSQGTNAGAFEFNNITSVNAGMNQVTLANGTTAGYGTGAQVVVIPQYNNVTIPATAVVTAPAWNGSTGGILAFEAFGTSSVLGSISMTGRGFRGASHTACQTGGARFVCGATGGMAPSFQGESPVGPGMRSTSNNSSGGGGGQYGQDCAAGGGGAYGAVGTAGGPGTGNGACGNSGVANQPGGSAGTVLGGNNLGTTILFGGAGGEGGADEDGSYPGGGGNGGGVILLRTDSITVGATGSIAANGAAGGDGVNGPGGCGGAGGWGMGGGGGGAGGGIRIEARTADFGTNRVTATGSAGGACTPGVAPTTTSRGGNGGNGRIGTVMGGMYMGTTSPAAVTSN